MSKHDPDIVRAKLEKQGIRFNTARKEINASYQQFLGIGTLGKLDFFAKEMGYKIIYPQYRYYTVR